MTDWKELAVEGHFYADKPWWDYHERLAAPLAKVVGAKVSKPGKGKPKSVDIKLKKVRKSNA